MPSLRELALAELDTDGCVALVLDLENMTFLDSTGIGCWIELRNRAEDGGKAFELHKIPPAARRTITIAGLAPIFGLDSQ